jgi:galactoside O-acetyltransferase
VSVLGRPQLGRDVRLRAFRGGSITLEDHCLIGDGSRLVASGGHITIQAGATIGDRCILVAHARIVVEAGAVLGDRVTVVDFEHDASDVERPIRLQPIVAAPVVIGPRARVGPGASLLRGVTVGAGEAIGAHAVVVAN